MEYALELRHLTKDYGRVRAVDDVTLLVRTGEALGFLGPNGAGKTTTLRVILGLARATSGEVLVGGAPAGSASARAFVASVPGDVALWPQFTGGQMIDVLLAQHGASDQEYRRDLVARFELAEATRVRAYSKGNRQKVALVAAFAARAPLLVLDEPTTGLDPLMERVFRECVSEATRRGQTVVLSSHQLSEVQHLCARVAMIRRGRLLAVEDVATLRDTVATTFEVVGAVGDLRDVAGVTQVEPTPDGVRLRVRGPVAPVLSALGARGATSVRTNESSLEEVFLSYYDDATDARDAAP